MLSCMVKARWTIDWSLCWTYSKDSLAFLSPHLADPRRQEGETETPRAIVPAQGTPAGWGIQNLHLPLWRILKIFQYRQRERPADGDDDNDDKGVVALVIEMMKAVLC